MKTKITFEPFDFKGGGQMIVRNNVPLKIKDFRSASTLAYKVGWMAHDSDDWCMVSLCDGMVIGPISLKNLINDLNNDEHGYHPLTKEEISAIMNELGNRF